MGFFWEFGCITLQSEPPWVQKILEYVTNIWMYGLWYHSVAAKKVCSFSYISLRKVELASWIICNFFLAFPNFRYLSSHTPPYLLVNCSILESPKKSEPWSDQLRDPEDIFPPENLSFHLSWPSLSECRNYLSLLLLLILCAWGLIWIEAISQDASAAPVLHSLQPLGLFSLLHVFTLFEISVQQLWCLWHSSLNQGLQLVALNILPCTGLFGRSLWQRTFF